MTSFLPRFAKTHAEWPENPDLLKPRPCRSGRPQVFFSQRLGVHVAGSHDEPCFMLLYHDQDMVFHHFSIIFPSITTLGSHVAAKKSGQPSSMVHLHMAMADPRLGTLLEGSDGLMAFFLVQASVDGHDLAVISRELSVYVTRCYADLW